MEHESSEKTSRKLRWPGLVILSIVFALAASAKILWATTLYYEWIPLGILAIIFLCLSIWKNLRNGGDA